MPDALTVVDPVQLDTAPSTVVDTILPSQPGITVDPNSVSFVHGASSVSYYSGSLAALGIGPGLLITSGTVPGLTNTVPWFGQDNGMAGDPDLDAVVNTVFATTSYDATSLSLNFDVSDPNITGVSFKIVFGTDEFPEWVDQFVDIAVVMVNGVNVAYFGNNPSAPLSVIGSNLAAGYFIDNADGHLPIEYDGVSNVLTVFAPVHLGTNSLKIAIADTGDHIYDSGLFISGFSATNLPVSGVNLEVLCTEGADDKVGTDASESFNALGGDDNINGAGGDDVIAGGAGADVLAGGAGKDFLDGGTGHDSVAGDSGDDTLQLSGDDAIDGGDGVDTLIIDASVLSGPVTLDISDPTAQQTLADGSTIQGIEVLKFTGGAEADNVTGGAFADSLTMGGGDDQAAGGGGDDAIDGGAGVDTAVFSGASADYQVTDLGGGALQVTDLVGGDGTDVLTGVEQLQFADGVFAAASLVVSGAEIHGTSGDDVISTSEAPIGQPTATALGDTVWGEAGDDTISSGAGDDAIHAGSGDDKVDAGAGDDVVYADAGHDEIDGGAGQDTVVYSGAYADYTVIPSGDGWDVTDNRAGPDNEGYDQLISVEHLVFSDTTLTVGIGAPPAITGGDVSGVFVEPLTPTGIETLAGSLTFTDPDHDDTHTLSVADATGDQSGVTFNPTLTVDAFDGQPGQIDWNFSIDTAVIDALAEGQVRNLSYVVRVDDSGGNHVDQTVSFQITGTNDAPVVSGDVTGAAGEGGTIVTLDALGAASDVDAGAKLIVTGVPATLPAGVTYDAKTHSFTLDPTDAAYQSLAAGVQQTVEVAYQVFDGIAATPAKVSFTVTGANNAPTVSGAVTGAASEDGAPVTLDALANASDPDLGDHLTVSGIPASLPAGVTYDAGTHSFTLDPGAAAYQALAAGVQQTVEVACQVSDGVAEAAAKVSFTVTGVNDPPIVAQPLSDAAGAAGTAFAYTAPAGTFSDADGETLVLSATLADGSALPAWLTFDAASGAFSGTPTAGAAFDVKLTATDGSGANASDVFHVDIAPPAGLHLIGTAGADALTGGAQDDWLQGLGGNDTLRGGGGNDLLEGGAGNDLLDGGLGNDTASYVAATAGVTVSLASSKAQNTGGAGKDTLTGIENLDGSAFADHLTGDAGANVLNGGDGADVLAGGGGADSLWGGAGADTFILAALANSSLAARDTIFDFSHAQGDHIDLSAIDAIAGGKNNAFSFVDAFTHKAGQLISVWEADHYVVQGDVNGDGLADFAINVIATQPLVASDFLL